MIDDSGIVEDTIDDGSVEPSVEKSPKRPFSKLAVELSDQDLESKGVQKLLLAEISRLESIVSKLEGFRDKYYLIDKDKAVLTREKDSRVFLEVLYSAGLTIGAALIGLTPSISSVSFSPILVSVFGAILIIISVIARVRTK